MKKGAVIIASALIAVGVVIFGAALFASGFDFSNRDTAVYETNMYTPGEDFEKIEIRTYEADIALKPSDDGKTRVECVESEKVRHEVSVENGTLKITAVDSRAWYDHIALFSFKRQSVTVYLPAENYGALTVTANTGDVSVPDRFSLGEARIATSTGDVSFDASADTDLKIETSTGDISVNGVCADSIDLSVSTGKIDCKNVECKKTLSVSVSTGKTVLTDVICRELVSDGSTGSLTLKNVIASDGFRIERDTGDVRFESCDAGMITVRTSTGDVTGTLRSEKIFVAKTSTGDVDVPDPVSGGRCEITTSTGDIRISVVE